MPKFLLPLAFLTLFACEKNRANDYDDLALVYAELRVAMQEYGERENGMAIRFQILEKHGLFADSFEIRTEELKKEPEKWLIFQKTVIDILDTITNSNNITKSDTTAKKDTVAK